VVSRPILCPNDATEDHELDSWSPSPANYWWRPKNGSRYPHSGRLLPGDVLLFQPLKPGWLQSLIIGHQSKRYEKEHAGYTHAAIYVGYDGLLCEAEFPGGVHLSNLDEKLEDCCMTVRRPVGLTRNLRRAIARGAVEHRNTRYGWEKLLQERFLPESLRERLQPPITGEGAEAVVKSLICSTLCSRALLRGGVPVLPPDRGLVLPAWLSKTPQLEDIDVGWRTVLWADPGTGKVPTASLKPVNRADAGRILRELAYFRWIGNGRRKGTELGDWLWAQGEFRKRYQVIE